MPDFGKVAVLFGGESAERKVSLLGGKRVLDALRRQNVDACAFDPAERRLSELEAFDRAFIVLHGRHGEDGVIQGVLESMAIPYTGSGVMASAVGIDKWRTKLLWHAVGLPTPDFEILEAHSDFAAAEARLGLPLFVKPLREGSSIGIIKVSQPGQLADAYLEAALHDTLDRRVIAERGIVGGEYTVTIVGDEALPIISIVPVGDFYDYEAKYVRDDTRYLCPCGLPETREMELRAQALEAFRVLGCRGWGRVDFLMDEHGGAYFLEVNTAPGMTGHSLAPMAARAAGLSYEQLVTRVLSLAALG
ncbi:MAG: D-alanine--D-alanine ligase [Candidatus Accumulibacter sp.]|jgi:D-alanine-D-alanine ligase|nr:D-alanine--D-alanine ligase [Accumulibacter sp.]